MIEDEISEIVAEHYQQPNQNRPLMLSNIGARLSKKGHWPLPATDKRSLLEIVESLPQVSVIIDPEAKSFIAIVQKGQENLAHEAIARRRQLFFLRGLPRAFLFAFTLELAEGEHMFVQLGSRITFHVGQGPAGPDAVEIDADLRLPELDAKELETISNDDARRFEVNIKEWCARHQVDPTSLKRAATSRSALRPPTPTALNALERLYAAQDSDIANRLTIPMDIALTLSRLP